MMCSKPKHIYRHVTIDKEQYVDPKLIVPCGKCLPCLSNKRNDWAFRLEQEYKSSKSAHFVTLTYHRKALKDANYELSKRDLQLYFKRLRKADPESRIRYYAVGEYGGKTGRPHYHIILFNTNEKNIRKSWDSGIVHVGRVTSSSIRYTLKYLVQPELAVSTKQKPFCLMSRGYGLGLNYLTDAMVSWHRNDDRNYVMREGVKCRLPRYYRDKIWYREDDRERVSIKTKWDAIKASRKELRFYVRRFGKFQAKNRMAESRNAVIQRIKIKVAFSQFI